MNPEALRAAAQRTGNQEVIRQIEAFIASGGSVRPTHPVANLLVASSGGAPGPTQPQNTGIPPSGAPTGPAIPVGTTRPSGAAVPDASGRTTLDQGYGAGLAQAARMQVGPLPDRDRGSNAPTQQGYAPLPPSAPPPPPAAPPPAAPPQAPQGAPPMSGIPGGFTTAQASGFLDNEDDEMLRQIARRMNINPDRPGLGGGRLLKLMQPVLESLGQYAGFFNGGTGEDRLGQANSLVDLAKTFTQPGVNAFSGARGMAQGVLGNQSFLSQLEAEPDAKAQIAMLQNLLPGLYSGANRLTQSAAQGRMADLVGGFRDAEFDSSGQGGPGYLLNYLRGGDDENRRRLSELVFGRRF